MCQDKDKATINARLKAIKHVALDMDGTIYKGGTLFPFTIGALRTLKDMNIRYSFLTNNPSKSTQEYLQHLRAIGIPAMPDEVYTSGQATIDYLQVHHPEMKRLFILGTPGMIAQFEEAGFISTADSPDDKPDAVVVAFDTSLVYPRLCRAAWWVAEKRPYIATNPDKVCPTDKPTILVDCGSICAAIAQATGRNPDIVIGKPAPRMLDGIMQRYSLRPDEIAMVGDRIYTDVAMAKNTQALGVLVLTGEACPEDVEKSTVKPDIVVNDLSGFCEMLKI
ncbi:MAG: HAD-IIA family hydrolase [Prevotellaceae bacterium]|jgi:NagD protein|nr:HAD-IIA family hydrolase [Prevotellaceae bacterium]